VRSNVSENNKARKVLRVLNLLEGRGDAFSPPVTKDPLEAFVAGVMMTSVSLKRAQEAVEQLKHRLVDWNEARVSTGKEISEYCSPVHVPESAGRTVQRALEKIHSDLNTIALEDMKGKSAKEVREYLNKIEGVPTPAVAYTMLYGLGKAAIPVTAPILRVAERIGLLEKGCPSDRAERFFERIVPSARMASFFEHFQWHGEQICHQKVVKCGRCVASRICDFHKAPASAGKASRSNGGRRVVRAASGRRVRPAKASKSRRKRGKR
jgi:endonuclease III